MEDSEYGELIANTSLFVKKSQEPRYIVAATCVLSMIGSAVIVITYFAFKQLIRNHTRHILMHLSLMDFCVALGNFIGGVVYFDKYYYKHLDSGTYLPKYIDYSCKIQAAVVTTCNNSSVLWTIAVAVYLHFRIVTHSGSGPEKVKFFRDLVCILAAICYGIPILITVWLGLTGRLGFAPYDSTGWCTIIVLSPESKKSDIMASVFGNDLWIYLAFLLILVLYFSIRFHAKKQYDVMSLDKTSKSRLRNIDHKFIAIPLIFILLKSGSFIVSLMEYSDFNPDHLNPHFLQEIILYFSGIGDSAQGFANSILFVCLTKTARNLLVQKIFCCWKCSKQDSITDTTTSQQDETSPLYSPDASEGSSCRTLVIIQDT